MTRPHARDILANNLRRWIQAYADAQGRKYSVRAWALSMGLEVRLIDRLTKGQNSVTIDTIEEIARATGLQPWHLLLEDADPKAPPDAPLSAGDRELIERVRRLFGPI